MLTPDPKGKQREVNATLLTTAGGEGVLVQDADDKTVALFRRSTEPYLPKGSPVTVMRRLGTRTGWIQMLLIDGTWYSDNGVGLTASVTIDCEMTVNDKEAVGSIIYPAVPGTKPFTVSLRLPQQSVTAVTSSGQILDWRFADDTLTLELAPGEHQLTLNLQ